MCAAAVRDAEGRVLVARRVRPAHLAGLWEFPGGKLEPGEDGAACLSRELDEELRLQVVVGDALAAAVENDADGGGLRLTVYASRPADAVDPRPEPVDGTHDRIRWVHGSELETLELAPLDRPLVAAVRAFLDAPDDHLS
ncbi:MAG: NUDIX domain-containing protein [Planctomycetota bacterium]|nr:NUDIX domain-containing protein [Planctomycetota bacterium]